MRQLHQTVNGLSTPFGEFGVYARPMPAMTDDGQQRLERLTQWIRVYRADLLDDVGQIGSGAFAAAIERKPNQVVDLLAGRKSFGDKAARHIEAKLDMPRLYLDGANSGWPFEFDFRRYDALSVVQKARLEQRMLDLIEEFEQSMGRRVNK